jgi:hypothetical protein
MYSNEVKCNKCNKLIAYNNYKTCNLWKHLETHLGKEKVEYLINGNPTKEEV